MMKRLRITVCALLVLMLLSGCAASQSSMKAKTEESYNYAYDTAAAAEPAYEPAMTTAEPESAAGGFDAGEADPNYGNHKIITTYTFEMRTDEFDTHFDKTLKNQHFITSNTIKKSPPFHQKIPSNSYKSMLLSNSTKIIKNISHFIIQKSSQNNH